MRIFLLLFMICFLLGCRDARPDEMLDRAEAVVVNAPDSALCLLERVAVMEKNGVQEARCALLYVEAYTKAKQEEMESDSLINIAFDYYKGRGASPELAKCRMYQGSYYVRLGLTKEAIEAFVDAEKMALKTNEVYLLGLIYDRWGNLCVAQGLFSDALRFYRKGTTCFRQVGSRKNESISLFGEGCTFLFLGQNDSALYYLNRAQMGALEVKDTSLYASILNVEGYAFLNSGNYVQGKNVIRQSIELMQPNVPPAYYISLGDVYRLETQYDSARMCVEWAMKHTQDRQAYMGLLYRLYEIGKHTENHESASSYLEQVLFLKDSIDEVNCKKSVLVFANKYNYELAKGEVKDLWTKMLFVLFFVILFFILVLWRKQYLQNRWKREFAEHQFQLEKLKMRLASRESQDEKSKELFQRQLDILKGVMLESPSKTLEYYKESLLNKPNEDGWRELETLINLSHYDFVDYLRSTYPQLKEDEIRLCYLVAIGFRTKEISVFLGKTESTIDNWRHAITTQLFPEQKVRFSDFIREALAQGKEAGGFR